MNNKCIHEMCLYMYLCVKIFIRQVILRFDGEIHRTLQTAATCETERFYV